MLIVCVTYGSLAIFIQLIFYPATLPVSLLQNSWEKKKEMTAHPFMEPEPKAGRQTK